MYVITISIPFIMIAGIAPFYYQKVISDRTEILTKSLIKSTDSNLENYLDEMERLTQTPYFDSNTIDALSLRSSGDYDNSTASEKYQADKAISNLMDNYFQNTEAHIAGILLISVGGSSFSWSSYGSSNLNPSFDGSKEIWFQKAIAANGRPVYISTHKQDYLIHSDVDNVFSVARLIRDPVTLTPLAVIMVDADTSVIKNMIQDAKYDVSSIVSIFNENGGTIYSTEALPGNIKNQAFNNSDVVTFKDEKYKVVGSNILKSNWKMVVMFSLADVNRKVSILYVTGCLFGLIGIILTMLVFTQYSRHITKPYLRITAVMNEVKKGNLKARIEVRGENEIAQLSHDFNNMLIRIDQLVAEKYRAKLDLRNAEYHALQSQIKPHFLFNTLNGFIALNRMDNRDTLEKSIFSLTRLMRYTLDHNDWVPAKEEFRFLDDYCRLQHLRFDNRLSYFINCDERLNTFKMPKLILQPLVENSIIHGIEPSDKMCCLEILGTMFENDGKRFVRFTVNDDGVGFDMDDKIKETSKGINNIRDRLKIAYGDNAKFSVQSKPCEGTKIEILIQQEELQ